MTRPYRFPSIYPSCPACPRATVGPALGPRAGLLTWGYARHRARPLPAGHPVTVGLSWADGAGLARLPPQPLPRPCGGVYPGARSPPEAEGPRTRRRWSGRRLSGRPDLADSANGEHAAGCRWRRWPRRATLQAEFGLDLLPGDGLAWLFHGGVGFGCVLGVLGGA